MTCGHADLSDKVTFPSGVLPTAYPECTTGEATTGHCSDGHQPARAVAGHCCELAGLPFWALDKESGRCTPPPAPPPAANCSTNDVTNHATFPKNVPATAYPGCAGPGRSGTVGHCAGLRRDSGAEIIGVCCQVPGTRFTFWELARGSGKCVPLTPPSPTPDAPSSPPTTAHPTLAPASSKGKDDPVVLALVRVRLCCHCAAPFLARALTADTDRARVGSSGARWFGGRARHIRVCP